jgi:pyruvate formate lyase activating enzyme
MVESCEKRGLISQIQHFSTGDGPGIRTTVFFQGCNLHCPWCHNPETISTSPVLMYTESLCSGCTLCADICPAGVHRFADGQHQILRSQCAACGLCSDRCPSRALQLSGRLLTLEQVMAELLEDQDFFEQSGGGVTFSGGEPLLQGGFLASLAIACRENGIHVIVDTAGQVNAADLARLIPVTDLFYFDLKDVSEDGYLRLGGCLEQVMERLQQLAQSRTPTVIRLPVIPGWQDQPDFAEQLIRLLEPTGLKTIELLPYHRLGRSKYPAIGQRYLLAKVRPPLPSVSARLAAELAAAGFRVRLGG